MQVRLADQSAVGAHVIEDPAGDFAAVEIRRAMAGDAAIGIAPGRGCAALRRPPAARRRVGVDFPGSGKFGDDADIAVAAGDGRAMPELGDVGADQATLFGVFDGGLDEVRQSHRPVAAQRMIEGREGAGGGDGLVADLVLPAAQDEAPAVLGFPHDAVLPHVGAGGGGGAAVEVDRRVDAV